MYQLGVLGGMGPAATALFFSRVVANTAADGDEGHIPSIVLNDTLVPDRTAALLGQGEDPVCALQADVDRLLSLGVSVIATPCNTAHAFLERLDFGSARFVNMVEETLALSRARGQRLCILGTSGLARARVYERAAGEGVEFVTLSAAEQEQTMQAINLVKASRYAKAEEALFSVAEAVSAREESVLFVLACTELSVLREAFSARYENHLDALEVLARRTVEACGYEVRV